MMETKLWIALCALLAIHLGSATTGDDHTAAPSSNTTANTVQTTGAPVRDPVHGLGVDPASHSVNISETDTASNGTDSVSSNTTTENPIIPITAETRRHNVTDTSTTLAKNDVTNKTSPSQSDPTARVLTGTNTTNTFVGTLVTPTSTSHRNTSSNQNQTTAPPATAAPKSEPKPTANAATTKSNTTSCTASCQKPSTAQPDSQTSSQLNVKGDTAAHNSPALDPLLAGLVSAFIIAAVIITLLLFLKLRRRGNRPEFRRLQELPMDEMEDTPLSMYSY